MKRIHYLLACGLSLLLASNGPFALAIDPASTPVAPVLNGWVETGIHPQSEGKLISDFPDREWWDEFQDPYLSTYINAAVRNNPNLNIAQHRVEEARALVKQNVALEMPSADISPSFYRIGLPNQGSFVGVKTPHSIRAYTIPLQASYELDLWGRNLNQIRSAKRQAEATELQAKATINSVMSEVASAYINLLRSDALVKMQTENLSLLQRVEALKRSQNQAGLVSYDEVLRSERDAAEAKTTLSGYQQQLSIFAHELAILTGSPPASQDQLERGNIETLSLPKETETGLPSDLLKRRPDILVQEKLLESSKLDVSVARKALLPKVNLSALFVLGALNFNKLFDWSNLVNLQSAVVSQPIFKGGKLMAEIGYRKAKQKEQLENYRLTILNAFKDVENSLSQVRAGYETMDSNAQRLALTQKDLGLTESLVQQGLAPRLNELQTQSEVIRYRQLAIQSKADTAIATVSLYKALGGGF